MKLGHDFWRTYALTYGLARKKYCFIQNSRDFILVQNVFREILDKIMLNDFWQKIYISKTPT